MKNKELIAFLKKLDPEMPIYGFDADEGKYYPLRNSHLKVKSVDHDCVVDYKDDENTEIELDDSEKNCLVIGHKYY